MSGYSTVRFCEMILHQCLSTARWNDRFCEKYRYNILYSVRPEFVRSGNLMIFLHRLQACTEEKTGMFWLIFVYSSCILLSVNGYTMFWQQEWIAFLSNCEGNAWDVFIVNSCSPRQARRVRWYFFFWIFPSVWFSQIDSFLGEPYSHCPLSIPGFLAAGCGRPDSWVFVLYSTWLGVLIGDLGQILVFSACIYLLRNVYCMHKAYLFVGHHDCMLILDEAKGRDGIHQSDQILQKSSGSKIALEVK